MNTHRPKFTHVLILCAVILLITLAVGAVTLRSTFNPTSRSAHSQNGWHKVPVPITSRENLPAVISKVKQLEAVSATISEAVSPSVRIEVRNKSDVAVTRLSISNGVVTEGEYGVTFGVGDPDHPQELIPASGSKTFSLQLSNLDAKHPILISGAFFSDGTEDGDKGTLNHMRSVRARDKAEKEQREKGGEQ
jgi:hypothetical protein